MSGASLPPGTRLGVYEVVGPIGAGGMGEVYHARDTKLNRPVALKILPPALSADADRLARFRREAQVLAALNHPNIAIIHGVEDAAEPHALVMEFVPGRTLADVIGHEPMPLDEALQVARQIASALEAAHEQGIVHRDLKPANIKVTDSGAVKVLDFGLAKDAGEAARHSQSGGSLATAAPTMTSPAMTEMGVILGTAGYMSPEQAKGRVVDRRADIWALGVVLFEMLTGARLYAGETVTETIAHVLTQPADWSKLPATTPAPIRRLLRRMLEKDPRNRMQSAGDVRVEIDEYLAAPERDSADARGSSPAPSLLRVFPWALAAALLVALVYALWPQPVAPADAMRMEMVVADRATLQIDESIDGSLVALSPDGRLLAFVGTDERGRRLYLRPMNGLQSTSLPNTDNPLQPFFSPDGGELAFFSNATLKRMPVTGGTPVPVVTVIDPRGADWAPDGTIVLTPDISAGLSRVASAGGELVPVTTLGPGERTHRWPRFLPGGRAALFMVQMTDGAYDDGTIEAVTIATGERKVLVRGGTYPMYVEPGFLLYGRQGTIYAVEFDHERLEVRGNPQPVLSGALTNSSGVGAGTTNGAAQFAVANGMAMYLTGAGASATDLELVVLDRTGTKEIFKSAERKAFRDVRFSPDGGRLGLRISDGRTEQLYILELARQVMTQVTFDGTASGLPAWAVDGRLAFHSNRSGQNQVYVGTAEATGDATPITDGALMRIPGDFTADGTKVLLTEVNPKTQMDIVQIDIASKTLTPIIATPAIELLPSLSPDGRWLAYMAVIGNEPAVYVRAFPGGGALRKVSPGPGGLPFWTREGREIVYVDLRPDLTSFYAVSVIEKGGVLELASPVKLFEFPAAQPSNALWFHVSRDGNRFAMFRGAPALPTPARRNATVVFNFVEEIRRALAK
jgi:serine/threonine-protein kinase